MQSTKETIQRFFEIYLYAKTKKPKRHLRQDLHGTRKTYPHETNNNILFRYRKIPKSQFSVP